MLREKSQQLKDSQKNDRLIDICYVCMCVLFMIKPTLQKKTG